MGVCGDGHGGVDLPFADRLGTQYRPWLQGCFWFDSFGGDHVHALLAGIYQHCHGNGINASGGGAFTADQLRWVFGGDHGYQYRYPDQCEHAPVYGGLIHKVTCQDMIVIVYSTYFDDYQPKVLALKGVLCDKKNF